MKEIFKQLARIWHDLKPLQKGAAFLVITLLVISLSFVVLKSNSSHLVPLYPGKTLLASEEDAIEAYLEDSKISYKIDSEKGVLVPPDKADQIRLDLVGMLKKGSSKGFELFDTNTWIKGEKELQVLEMRALKGQLEKDLAAFENIKSASVILDIPPQRTFNGSKFQTKASVILTLMPREHLSPSQLRAIINHLTGAVRGLEPQMIAVSDTSGKLYKAIDPQKADDPLQDAALLFEERVQEKVSALLSRIVGEECFYTNVQAIWNHEKDEASSLSLSVVIDFASIAEAEQVSFKEEVEKQLKTIAKGYGVAAEVAVDFLPFDQTNKKPKEEKGISHTLGWIFLSLFLISVVVAIIPTFKKKKKQPAKTEEGLFQLMTRIDTTKLAASIQNEDPKTIAMMLSYLEPKKADEMIASLDAELQDEVLYHLAELEKGETT